MKRHAVWALALLSLSMSSCTALRYNVPNVTDYKIFKTSTVQRSNNPTNLIKATNNAILPDEFLWAVSKKDDSYYEYASPEKFLEEMGTHSLIIVRNDSILYEKYFNGFQPNDIQTVFSITKSFASALTAIAIQEGYIKSIYQPVSDFIPEYKFNGRDKITINHLLQMTSGVAEKDFKDLGKLMFFYYAKDQEAKCEKLKMRYLPGTHFQYSSMTTQILGMCVERATGKKFAEYLREKIWNPLGMEHDALVSLDKNGSAKQYGGLTANPRDLVKFGQLYLKKGNWNGKQIISEDWVKATQTRDTIEGKSAAYSHCFWLDTYPLENKFDKEDYFAGGFRGQVIYVNPKNNTVIVRTGHKEGSVHWGRALSKLSHFPLKESDGAIDEQNVASLNGKYKNKFGKIINLSVKGGKLILHDDDDDFDSELEQSSNVTFIDKKHGKRVLVELNENQIKGLIVEAGKESYYYTKS